MGGGGQPKHPSRDNFLFLMIGTIIWVFARGILSTPAELGSPSGARFGVRPYLALSLAAVWAISFRVDVLAFAMNCFLIFDLGTPAPLDFRSGTAGRSLVYSSSGTARRLS